MERFEIKLPAASVGPAGNAICGVVASGNLEVMVEPSGDPVHCFIEVNTSASGFQEIWKAVLTDFSATHSIGGLSLSINDAGATPAVVSLRLAQAFETCRSKP